MIHTNTKPNVKYVINPQFFLFSNTDILCQWGVRPGQRSHLWWLLSHGRRVCQNGQHGCCSFFVLRGKIKPTVCQCFWRSGFWKSVYPLFTQWLISSCPYWRWLAFGTCIWPNWSRPKLKRPRIPTGCPSPPTVPPATLALESLAQFNQRPLQRTARWHQ